MHHQAMMRVSFEELARALKLPAGARIVAVGGDLGFKSNEVLVKVEHPDLPELRESNFLSTVTVASKFVCPG